MIHYIILMEAKAFHAGSYHTLHFYKKGERNETPDFRHSAENSIETIRYLTESGFEKISSSMTIEEIILNDVSEITVFFFDNNSQFERTGVFRRHA